jgi:hypothetical protein
MGTEKLLKPITHKRYITCYCVADLEVGSIPIKDTYGNTIASISERSKIKLQIEGTGRLSSGDIVNVVARVGGEMVYTLVPNTAKFGYGIRGKPLEPWSSVAVNLIDIHSLDLFKRTLILPKLKGFVTPDGKTLDGRFIIHDTGSGLRKCPYSGGLFRADSEKKCGQVDVFVGSEKVYRGLLGSWETYQDCIVMPTDTYTPRGIQETLNLLMDSGLKVDGVVGTKTRKAINDFKHMVGLEEDCIWDDNVKEIAKLSLENWG